jgi:hypothetical protein
VSSMQHAGPASRGVRDPGGIEKHEKMPAA